ncbi:MAG: hypothetical protein FWE82_02555 [Defluviitaleaceae bacterium]|nr:hypothetical protein [Defluviitaleaceae bacterium]
MNPPKTYAEWVTAFDALKSRTDDAAVLQAIKKGSIEWQSGVAERFVKKLTDTINSRMNAANERFQRDMNNARGQEGPIVQALLALRKEMIFLTDAINLPAIPEKDRDQYVRLVRSQADGMQRSLEDSAKKDRSGKMSSIVRNHKINAV